MLSRYVREGSVDYAGLARSGRADLDAYLHQLANACASQKASWPRDEKLAYWLNAYNAFTIQLILDHYPTGSIRSIGLLPGAAFRTSLIDLAPFWSEKLSLNDIESGVLREQLHEPRIHFAIVCASKSCPILQSSAYRASAIDAQLDEAARRFIQDPSRNRYDAANNTLYLSSIFKWFRADFEAAAGTLTAFVARYAEPAVHERLARGGDARVEFLDYDWSLNGQ